MRRMIFALLCILSTVHGLKWWQTATVYQIYPRSYHDALLADGIGDILGITMKLPHLVDIGVGAIWLSPVFKSPMKDFGYDISDFRDVDPIFGTMKDLEDLIAEAHKLDLKIILDIVPNHCSDEHEWFIKSVNREEPYTDYFTWLDATEYNGTGYPLPPNNWLSVFGGSAWEWNEQREQFYLHQFVSGQPDLNYHNPKVLEEMNDILSFWLDKGVDGFRIDAVPHLMEDQTFPDEPESGNPEATPDQYAYLNHIYTKDLPELYDIIISFRKNIDQKQEELDKDLVMMVEAYTSIENTMKYYGNETHPGAHFPFNFQFIEGVKNETRAQNMKEIVDTWYENMPEGAWANWVIGNHDQSRVASRFGRDFSLAAQMVSQLLPGTAITYNGEEINMEDTWISWKDTVDPQGCQAGIEYYEKFSRDPERTPYQWSAEANAGFCPPDSNLPWLPINQNYKELNLAAQNAVERSPYHIYKMLTAARKTRAVQSGTLHTQAINENVFAFARYVNQPDEESLLVIINLGQIDETVDGRIVHKSVPDKAKFYTGSLNAEYQNQEEVSLASFTVPARGGVVFQYSSSSTIPMSMGLLLFAVLYIIIM